MNTNIKYNNGTKYLSILSTYIHYTVLYKAYRKSYRMEKKIWKKRVLYYIVSVCKNNKHNNTKVLSDLLSEIKFLTFFKVKKEG